ncbi:response regulator [Tellurirhabdus rosea]|uniref:response regulator n=1 Tax=Tellurirhabdus rosea TaxID=2674997 RepID=UPI00225B206D|nr:response regulator [Tellurirhabdus rosea]
MLSTRPFTVLIADDDEEDRMLLEEAFMQNGLFDNSRFVEDGEQTLAYLQECFNPESGQTLPSLIILDVNMPLKNGIETLQAIRADRRFRTIPVLMLTSSRAELAKAYRLGANSYLVKPVHFADLIQMVKELMNYWRDTVSLPMDSE